MKFAPDVPPDFARRDATCFVLDWIRNKAFYHECLRRALASVVASSSSVGEPQPLAPLLPILVPQRRLPGVNAPQGRMLDTDFDDLSRRRGFSLDVEQKNVCLALNQADVPLFFINALAGVGKTALLNSILYAATLSYQANSPEDDDKVLLVLLPSRELREDLARDIIGNDVFSQQEILWLGRPPTGSALGMWDELLQDRLKEIQAEAWSQLDQIKEDLVSVLSQLNSHRGPEPEGSARRTSQAEGRDKNDQAWSYGALLCQVEVDLRNSDWGLGKYLEDLFLTKQVLRQHILLEVTSILGERDAALKSIARRARVVLATADAFTKSVAKCSSGPASAILKEKKVEVAFF